MRKSTLVCFLMILASFTFSQEREEAIRQNAIQCNTLSAINSELYLAFKDYKCICIGEMHGTKEPAEFMTGLVKTFIKNNKKVVACFEENESGMKEFLEQKTEYSMSQTSFFKSIPVDGRSSHAWYNAIKECLELQTKFCFFNGEHDSIMARNLILKYEEDTNYVMITISGNIHNSIVPYRGNKTMGYYLKDYFKDRLYCINHIYAEGTMYNKTSEGLKIHNIERKETILSISTKYSAYFIPNIFSNLSAGYNGFLFTQKVTASLPYNPK